MYMLQRQTTPELVSTDGVYRSGKCFSFVTTSAESCISDQTFRDASAARCIQALTVSVTADLHAKCACVRVHAGDIAPVVHVHVGASADLHMTFHGQYHNLLFSPKLCGLLAGTKTETHVIT